MPCADASVLEKANAAAISEKVNSTLSDPKRILRGEAKMDSYHRLFMSVSTFSDVLIENSPSSTLTDSYNRGLELVVPIL